MRATGQAGPKILSDLHEKVSDCCKIYATDLRPKGGYGIQSLVLEMPLKSCYTVSMEIIPSNSLRGDNTRADEPQALTNDLVVVF